MKNKSGRTICFRRYAIGGLYPSTIEGFALLLGIVALEFGLVWLIQAKRLDGLTSLALFLVIFVIFWVVAYRHSGPPD